MSCFPLQDALEIVIANGWCMTARTAREGAARVGFVVSICHAAENSAHVLLVLLLPLLLLLLLRLLLLLLLLQQTTAVPGQRW